MTVLNFPLTTLAENKILGAGDILESLENIPMADISRCGLTKLANGVDLGGYDLLMNLAMGFYQLAFAVRSYEVAQKRNKERAGA